MRENEGRSYMFDNLDQFIAYILVFHSAQFISK